MSILAKCIEVEEFVKGNNSNLTPHFVRNEIFEVAGWTVPPLRKFKKGKTMVKKEIINKLKDLELAIEALSADDDKLQGNWIKEKTDDNNDIWYRCSNCEERFVLIDNNKASTKPYNFCPSCGARMKGADNE